MDNIFTRISNFASSYFAMSASLVPQSEAETAIRDDVSFRGTNILILVLAILIASLGLNTNSTAVIIGAMLISPLMGYNHRPGTRRGNPRLRLAETLHAQSCHSCGVLGSGIDPLFPYLPGK